MRVALLPPAPFGALLGIPGGIGIYDAAKNGGGTTTVPSALWLVAMVVLTLLVIAVLTAIPTLLGSTTSVRPRIVPNSIFLSRSAVVLVDQPTQTVVPMADGTVQWYLDSSPDSHRPSRVGVRITGGPSCSVEF